MISSPARPAAPLPGLDGLRAVAVGLVLLDHGQAQIPWPGGALKFFWLAGTNGGLGVRIFFVLSGFLITHLLKQEIHRTGKIHLGFFYLRRVLRIFPAFYFFLACVAALVVLGRVNFPWSDLVVAGTYGWNYRFFTHPPAFYGPHLQPDVWYLGHTWTLDLEEQFYLLWPATLLFLGLKRGAVAAAGILAVEPALRAAGYFWLPTLRLVTPPMLPFALDPLMVGSLAALWSGEPWFESMVNRCLKGWVVAAAVVYLVLLSPQLTLRFRGSYELVPAPTLESLGILAVLLWLLRHAQTRFGRFLNWPPVVALGVLSYSLYLWQQLFLVPKTSGLWMVQRFPLNYVCCFGAALFSFYVIEKPFLRLKDKIRFSQPRLAQAPAPPAGPENTAATPP